MFYNSESKFCRAKRGMVFILGLFVCFNLIAWVVVYDLNKPRLLEICFFDVGQGDSIFIETPEKQQILIDGGPSSVILEKLAQEMPFYDKTIDLIILTHPEHDHIRGLFDVLERYEVENILWTGVINNTNEYKEWIRLIKNEGADIKIAQAGQEITLSESIFIDILYPFENLDNKEIKQTNDTSIVARLVFNDVSFLFTGDISKKIELELVERKSKLKSRVLKVGHHGSKTSSHHDFLEMVSAEIGIIQCGKDNRYGHPYEEVLSRLEESDIDILRTDEKGDIKILSDGDNYKIK